MTERYMLLVLVVCLVSPQILFAQEYRQLPPDGGGAADVRQLSDELQDEERTRIMKQIEASRQRLIEQGLLPIASKNAAVSFGLPLRPTAGITDPGYHLISNFVDQDRSGGPRIDYNCGLWTYDNHSGIDFVNWPFKWYKMDHDQVEVVAAADGTIVFKVDGYYDRSCTASGGAWNAVYLEYADGSISFYGHLKNGSVTSKAVGESVSQGEYLGVVGSSGNSTEPHLHFETYDPDGNLIEPFAGPCNSLNADSWWTDQPLYYESAISALHTHGEPPIWPDCPQQETPNYRDIFFQGGQVLTAAYFRDIVPGMQAQFRIRTPTDAIWSSWSHTYQAPNVCRGCWWYWIWNLPSAAQPGAWTLEADFNGESYSHPFMVVVPDGIYADVKVFLEGAYAGGGQMMTGGLFETNRPLTQPYSDPEFDGTPLDHDSTVMVTTWPESTVDWVLASLRTDVAAVTEVPNSKRPALLLADGSVVDTSGTLLRFDGVAPGPYRIVVRHRNHLSVLSSDTLDLSDGFGSWDFTTSMTKAYISTAMPLKDLGDGNFGIFASDASVDGQVTASDFNAWLADTKAALTGYQQTDFNLDGNVTAADFNLWLANAKAAAASQVPN